MSSFCISHLLYLFLGQELSLCTTVSFLGVSVRRLQRTTVSPSAPAPSRPWSINTLQVSHEQMGLGMPRSSNLIKLPFLTVSLDLSKKHLLSHLTLTSLGVSKLAIKKPRYRGLESKASELVAGRRRPGSQPLYLSSQLALNSLNQASLPEAIGIAGSLFSVFSSG